MSSPFRLLAPRPRTIERDTFDLVLADGRSVEVQRVRDPRARRIRLSVDDRGARLTLPARASAATAEGFAIEQREWLAAQLDRHAPDDLPRLQPFETAALPLRGGAAPLRWQAGRLCRLQFAVPGGGDTGDRVHDDRGGDPASGAATLVFTLPPRAGAAAIARALRDFYEAQARADVGRWLPRYLGGLPRPPRRFRFKVMRSQWGSLAPDGSVALDLSLVLARPSAFEYVLVHELCHLIHHDHSRAFWHEVAMRWPHWRDERAYFHAHGARLKGSLRSLLAPGG